MAELSSPQRRLYASVDATFIGRNGHPCCAAQGPATVLRGTVDYRRLTRALKPSQEQFVTFAQTVGYPPRMA